MLIQTCPHFQTFVDHTAWETAKAAPTLTRYTCTDCAMIENQTDHQLPKTKELVQLEQDQMLFHWTANQQGVVTWQPHGEDHLWEPIPCEPTLVGSSVDSLGNLIVKGTPGYVITDTNRRQAIVLCCYEFNDQNGQPIPSHLQGRLWVTDIFATQQPASFLLHYPCHPADFQATPPAKPFKLTKEKSKPLATSSHP